MTSQANTAEKSTFRRASVICLCLAVVAFLGWKLLRPAQPEAPRETVLYVTLTLANPFYEEMIDGLRSNIGSWDLATQAGTSASDSDGQRKIMEAYLVRHHNKDIR